MLEAAASRLRRVLGDEACEQLVEPPLLGVGERPEVVPLTLVEELLETTLYRIVQEALTNIVKHAHARKASVLVIRRPGKVTAVIEDDGDGFQVDEVRDDADGLIGMRERLALHDGRLVVESSPESGTALVVEVPL